MKIVVSHPTGNQFVRALISALSKNGMLSEFYTSIAVNPESSLLKILPEGLRQECLRRTFNLPKNKISPHPALELIRLLSPKIGLKNLTKHEVGFASVDAVYKHIDKKVAARLADSDKPDAIYAYEDGAFNSFKQASNLGIKCLYDLPIGYWRTAREMLYIEREKWPDWAATLPGFKDSDQKLQKKDEELLLADQIFVASTFTKKTLDRFPGKLAPVHIVPYGFPPTFESRVYNINLSDKRPLKIIFVGGLSQRKGIANLFAAVETFGKKVELTVIGNKSVEDCYVLNEALSKHRYIPSLPHDMILKLMREHDVMVFPSLFEGFGLVITESMAQGTPVITTERTAGLDIINNGENGWLIEAGSTETLQNAIESILLKPEQIAKVGKSAMETARQRPWEVYGQDLLRAIIGDN